MRAAWQIHNLCRMEKQEPTPLKKLIRAFFWGNELKAFPLLKSAIFAFPHERHLKPTTASTTWNSKQKPKSAIFCFFSHSFYEKILQTECNIIKLAWMYCWGAAYFLQKERLKKQKIADLGFCFEFQVVVAVVGFSWQWQGNEEKAD